MHTRLFLPAALIVWVGSGIPAAAQSDSYRNPQLLIETGELSATFSQPDLCLLDARPPEEYAGGHLPGAVNLPAPATDDLNANGLGFPITVERARGLFWAAGVNNTSRVVVYDDQGNRFATRVFYVLEFFGHPRVQVLNGGIAKWKAEGRALITDVPTPPPGNFSPAPHPDLMATSQWVKKHLKDRHVRLVDARSTPEFTGEEVRGDRGGHIPKALSLEWTRVMSPGEVKTLLPAAQLEELFAGAGINRPHEVVTYCQVGIRASAVYFALRLLGFERLRIYDGSWQEWSANPTLPVEK